MESGFAELIRDAHWWKSCRLLPWRDQHEYLEAKLTFEYESEGEEYNVI